jgi:hypothetical protein
MSNAEYRQPDPNRPESPVRERRPYHAPAVEDFGDIKNLTRSDFPSNLTDLDGGAVGPYIYSGTPGT